MIQINGRQIPAVILAGGQSSRMGGGDKTLLKLEHKSILSAILDRLSVQVSTVILNANGNSLKMIFLNSPRKTELKKL